MAPLPKSRKDADETLRFPKTSLTPLPRWIVPPERVTTAELFTWLLCERISVALLATETEAAFAAAPPTVLANPSTPPLTANAPV